MPGPLMITYSATNTLRLEDRSLQTCSLPEPDLAATWYVFTAPNFQREEKLTLLLVSRES